jgi:hypothetical protein
MEQKSGAHAGQADDADDDQVDREQEHADVLVEVHFDIVDTNYGLCTPKSSGVRGRAGTGMRAKSESLLR